MFSCTLHRAEPTTANEKKTAAGRFTTNEPTLHEEFNVGDQECKGIVKFKEICYNYAYESLWGQLWLPTSILASNIFFLF